MFDFFEDLEYGMDLAATASILIAALSFIWQSAKQRKRNRRSEIWTNFKEIADEIAEQKIEIIDLIAKQLYYKEDNSQVTKDDLVKTISNLKVLINKLVFHIRYDAKQSVKNILAYHGNEKLEGHPIVILTDKTFDNIDRYFGWLKKVGETEDNAVGSQIKHIVEATINETTLRELEERKDITDTDVFKQLYEIYEKDVKQLTENSEKDKNDQQNENPLIEIKNKYELTENKLIFFCVWTHLELRNKFDYIKDSEKRFNAVSNELLTTLEFMIVKYKYSLEITLGNFNQNLLKEIKQL